MFVFILVYSYIYFSIVESVSFPPTLVIEPDSEIIFDPTLPLKLPCHAQGDPTPVYSWIKDGQVYNRTLIINDEENQANSSGTLTLTQPNANDQGLYQCKATNILGTVVSRRVHLRLADLGHFPLDDRPQSIQVRRGDSLKILCRSPAGLPPPEIYWTENSLMGSQYGSVASNSRIQQDYSGNLYFLNIKDEDEQKQFVCNVFSRQLNLIRRGALTQLKVIKTDPIDRKPRLLWSSESTKTFLKGQNLTLKCIFGGLPTPDVIWRKLDGDIPEKRSIVDGRKQELTINDLRFEDAGFYQCRGHNELGYDDFNIRVDIEAAPKWKNKPKDLTVGEGDTAEFICEAFESRPATTVRWFVNGVSMQDPAIARNTRRRVSKNRMVIQNVSKLDIAVYQCNISNRHGYLLGNFFLNVNSERPEIQTSPDLDNRLVAGQNLILPCAAVGSPKPKIIWTRNNRILSGERYSTSNNGSLMIRAVAATDNGIYICNATNKLGSDIRNATVTVKQKTEIQTKPNSQEIRRGYSVVFRCIAKADSSLTYRIDWYKDGTLITYTGRFVKDLSDQNSLKILDVQFDDAGIYVCRASTDLDFDEASATLVVQDRPNRPKITKVICNGSASTTMDQPFAIVQWEPTGDNFARILYYELQYNTSFQQNEWISVAIEQRRESFTEIKNTDGAIKLEPKTTTFKTTHLPSNQYDLQVPLACWVNYTFRLIAYNRIGASEASLSSKPMCLTETCRPKTNPESVRSASTQSIPLLIEWETMPATQWGAPTFWYEVGWRQFPVDNNPPTFLTQKIYPPQNKFAIPNSVTNMRYQYYVKAVNQQPGESNVSSALESPIYHIAFAGDAAPTYVPRNFHVLRMLDSSTVQFGWDPPLPADEMEIRGVLKAYQIEMFRLDDPEKSRVIVSGILPNQTWTTVFNAPPNADVGAHICIETERYFGPTSAVIQFPTREGRPGPVTNLRAVPYASNGIFLLWDSPEQTNGIIIGYQIDYNTIESIAAQPDLDQPSILLRDDTRRSYLLGGLQPNRKYRVQVRAQTSVGLSTRPAIIELTTNQTLIPSKPTFIVTQRGTTFFNISFDPTILSVPGSLYYVQYKENINDEQTTMKKTYAVSNERTILVSSLEPGKTYITQLVAGDGILSETASDPQLITTQALDRAPRVIKSPWFIGLIVSLILLMIVIAIVCGILKRKGGKYSVQDKEMLNGPSGFGDDDGKFSEYYRAPSDASIKRSRSSLNNAEDRDSMAEFNDEKDRGRFTEDGSFIGQYGRDDPRRSCLIKYDDNDAFINRSQQPDSTNSSSNV